MSTILNEIVAHKRQETEERKSLFPVKLLERSMFFETQPVSLASYIQNPELSGIIAEFKRKSPSKGMINAFAKVESVSLGYMQAGASALSILTDEHFFGGKSTDLTTARKFNYCPILRKDFILDEYQVIESKSIGADAILLIASILETNELAHLHETATQLGMEVLVEIHSREELDKLPAEVKLVGINNRNLADFTVNIENSLTLASELPAPIVKIAESGIESPETLIQFKSAGFDGFLIGGTFMETANPGKTCARFIQQVAKQIHKDPVSE